MDFVNYREQLNNLKELAKQAMYIGEKYEDEGSVSGLKGLMKDIEEDSFQLIVVGEFSRGKSTLVNAILGRDVLPSDYNPTTIMLNVIRNSNDGEHYIIHYRDETVKEISKEEFKGIVAKTEDLGDNFADILNNSTQEAKRKLEVNYAEIRIENEFGKMGVDVVDTPGINDIDKTREEITFNYIPRSDAAVVVCSAIQQLTSTEYKFIKDQLVDNQITKIFVAVGYADTLHTEDERQRVKDLFEKGLEGIVPSERIFLVSSLHALKYKLQQQGKVYKTPIDNYEKTGFGVFEDEILKYLVNEKGNIKINNYKNRLAGIIVGMITGTMNLRIQATNMSRDDLMREIARLRPKAEELKSNCAKQLDQAYRELLSRKRKFSKEYEKKLGEVGDVATKAVRNYVGNDVNELHDIITDSVIPYELELYHVFLKQMQDEIQAVYVTYLQVIGEDFAEIGIETSAFNSLIDGTNGSELAMVDENQVAQMMAQPQEQEITTLQGVLFLGATGLAVAGIVTMNPFIFAGARALAMMFDKSIANEKNNDVSNGQMRVTPEMIRKVFEAEVKKCYIDSIGYKVELFNRKYEASTKQILEGIKKDCDIKLNNRVEQLDKELQEKTDETEYIKERVKNIHADINTLKSIGISCDSSILDSV